MNKPKSMRTIAGLVVPWDTPGRLNLGLMRFGRGSVTWSQPERVKLLLEHDPNRVIGYAASLEETDAGLYGAFLVDDTPEALSALASAARMVRDGFSIGVELDDASLEQVSRAPRAKGGAAGAGVLREVSLVSIPAFDDARVDDVEADALKLPAAAAAGAIITTPGGTNMSPKLATAAAPRLATASAPTGLAIATSQADTATTDAAPAATASSQADTATEGQEPAQGTQGGQDSAQAANGAQTATGAGNGPQNAAQAPRAAAGATTTAHERPVYGFDGRGESFVLDVFRARHEDDAQAAARLSAFRRAMVDPDSQQRAAAASPVLATAAVETTTTLSGNFQQGETYRGDLLLRAIDAGRPLVSRVRNIPISGPNPFRLPTFGEFDGVADHVEGTSHVAEGTTTADGQVVVPVAVSGAYRLSRELAESTGPSIDRLVIEEMVKDYRRQSEARLVAALETAVPVATVGIDTPDELLGQLVTFYAQRQETPTVIGMGATAYPLYATAKASDGRPYFPFLGASNTAGTSAAALAALNIQGVPGVPAWSADAVDQWMLNGDDVAVFEAAPRTFTFSEVEGPGIIKLAIWGYQAAHVFRTEGVRRLSSAAA